MPSSGGPSVPVSSATVVSSFGGGSSGRANATQPPVRASSAAPPTPRPRARTAAVRRLLRVLLLRLQLVELAAELVAQRGAARVRRGVALRVGHLLGPRRALDRQPDLALGAVGVEHLDLHRRARRQHRARVLDVVLADLGHVDQALDALLQLDERAEVEHLEHLAVDDLARRVVVRDAVPRIGHELLDAERDLRLVAVAGVDVEQHGLDLVALLEQLARVLHPLRPAHVADVDEAVDALLDLHEDAEVRDVADVALHGGAGRVLLGELLVRVRLELLHAERDAVLLHVDVEHDRLDHVADGDHLRRVLHAARPRHLGDVDEALDALLELDEGAVVLERDDLAADDRAGHVLLGGAAPRILGDLLEAQRDALGVGVELQHLHAHVVADLEQLARVVDPAPAHVGDVQEAVDTAEVDERTVLGEVLDDTLDDLAFLQALERRLLEGRALLLEQHATRQHDVAALLVELDDLELEVLAKERVEVANRAQVYLRTGEERLHAAA